MPTYPKWVHAVDAEVTISLKAVTNPVGLWFNIDPKWVPDIIGILIYVAYIAMQDSESANPGFEALTIIIFLSTPVLGGVFAVILILAKAVLMDDVYHYKNHRHGHGQPAWGVLFAVIFTLVLFLSFEGEAYNNFAIVNTIFWGSSSWRLFVERRSNDGGKGRRRPKKRYSIANLTERLVESLSPNPI